MAVSVAANIVFDITLIPMLGVRGACIGTVAAEWVYFGLSLGYLHKEMDLSLLRKPLVKILMSGMAMALVINLAGSNRPLLASVAGLSVFAAVMLLTRAVPKGTLRVLREALRKQPREAAVTAEAAVVPAERED
jgi:Na+-driven multidrug efflux pump